MDLSGVDGRWDDGSNTTKSSMDETEEVHAACEERFQWPTSGRQRTRVALMRRSTRRRWLGHGTRWTIAKAGRERCNGLRRRHEEDIGVFVLMHGNHCWQNNMMKRESDYPCKSSPSSKEKEANEWSEGSARPSLVQIDACGALPRFHVGDHLPH